MPNEKEFIDKMVSRFRKISENLNDFRIATRLASVIACITKEKKDIAFALEKAKGHSRQSSVAEALSIIAKTLAQAGRFKEAREVLLEMHGMDAYWVAESRIQLARFSGDEDDIETAKDAVLNIRSHQMRNEAKIDLEMAMNEHHRTSQKNMADILEELNAILRRLESFEDGNEVLPKANSAKLRLLAQTIIYHIFADMMD